MDKLFLLQCSTGFNSLLPDQGYCRRIPCSPTISLILLAHCTSIQTYCHGSHIQKENKMTQIFHLTFPSGCQISLQNLSPAMYSRISRMHSLHLMSYFFSTLLSNPITFHSTTVLKPLLPRLPILSSSQIQWPSQSAHLIQLSSI